MKHRAACFVRAMAHTLALALLIGTPALGANIDISEVDAGGFPASLYETGEGPIVILVAGSGQTDRNGNSPVGITASYLEKLAGALAAEGFSSLRYDKRGVVGSAKVDDEAKLTLDDFVADLDAVRTWAGQRWPERPAVLAGHSEGGLIAMLASAVSPPAGLVLLAAPGRPPAEILRMQMSRLPDPLHEEALDILSELEAGRQVTGVPTPLAALFRPSVQPFVISLVKARPAETLATVETPVMIVGGGTDLQVGEADFKTLASARPDATSLWLPAMNHVLTDSVIKPTVNFETYRRPDLPLSKGLSEGIVEFLRSLSQD